MKSLLFAATSLLLAVVASPAWSQEEQSLQQLVNQLKQVTERARQERAADRWLLNALEDLVIRYDWPWSDELVSDDFSDGDYANDPAWQVASGQFWVDGRLGLRSRSQAEPRQSEPADKRQQQDLGQALLGAFMDQAMRKHRQEPEKQPTRERRNEPAEIRLPQEIPPVFSVQADFSVHNPPSENGQIEFGLYQDAASASGYRLVIYTGNRPAMELVSRRGGRTSVVDSAEIDGISDGNTHTLEWRRGPRGGIVILLDQNQLVKISDRSFRRPFNLFSITNRAGDFAVSGITLHGG